MEPLISFILNTASSVLSDAISNKINGQNKAVTHAELERQVSQLVAEEIKKSQAQTQDEELKKITAEILSEIQILADRDKDIKLGNETIELKSGPSLPFVDSKEARLKRLYTIVNQRRQELGLPESRIGESAVDESKVDRSKVDNDISGWSSVDKEPEKSYWQTRVDQAIRRIQVSRSGGDLTDES